MLSKSASISNRYSNLLLSSNRKAEHFINHNVIDIYLDAVGYSLLMRRAQFAAWR